MIGAFVRTTQLDAVARKRLVYWSSVCACLTSLGMNFTFGNGVVFFQALYAVTGMPKTAITIEVPRSTPSTDADKAKDNGGNGAEETKDKEKKEGEGGGLYDLKTRKKIQSFLEV